MATTKHPPPSPKNSQLRQYYNRCIDKFIDPGRPRTCNPRLRRPMPYPLGHGPNCILQKRTTGCTRLIRHELSLTVGLRSTSVGPFLFYESSCGLVALTAASRAEGGKLDPRQLCYMMSKCTFVMPNPWILSGLFADFLHISFAPGGACFLGRCSLNSTRQMHV